MRSPLRDPLKQEESSLLVIFGKRREFLSRELFYLLASLHLDLKKTEESSLLGSMDRAPPAFNQKKVVAPPKLQTKRSDPPSTFNMKANSATSCSKSTRKLPPKILVVREEDPLPLGKSPLSLQKNEETSLLARKDTAPRSLQKQRMSSLPHPQTISKITPISLERRELL